MNFRPFGNLVFDGEFVSVAIASWLPTFTQPGRLVIYADGTTLAGIQLVKIIPRIPDPWRATTVRSSPAPKKGVVIRAPAEIVSSPPIFKYQAPPALPSNVGYTIVSVPDPWRSTSTPLYGPQKPFIIPEFLSWQPIYVQPGRPILRAPGTNHVKDDWRFPEAVSADKWQATTVQPIRSILRASGTSAVDRLLEIIFADKWQPTMVQPGRAITYAKGTDSVLSRELITADKWQVTYIQPGRAIVRGPGTDLAVVFMAYDLMSVLTNAPVSITGTAALTSTDFGTLHICSGTTTNYNVTLPSPTGNANKFIGFRMDPALTKLVTIKQNAAEKIDGANTRIMWAGESAFLYTDGTNWFKLFGKSIPMSCTMYRAAAFNIPTGAVTAIPYDSTLSDPTGLMANIGAGYIQILRPGNNLLAAQSSFTLTAGSVDTQAVVSVNGGGIVRASMYAPSGATPGIGSSGTYLNAAGDTIASYCYQSSGNNSALFAVGAYNFVSVIEILSW